MASIGPQIPSRLQKRSTTPDLDDERGPIPKAPSAPSASIGPQIPANLLPARAGGPAPVPSGHNDEDEDEDEDSFGPALPPDLAISRTAPERLPVSSGTASQTRRIVGPSMPGHDRQTESDDSDSDDDYGPKPMAAGVSESDGLNEGVREFMEKEERRRKEVEEAAKPKKPKRDEWMLAPPSSSDLLGKLTDPTKLKARQFSRGGSSATRGAPNNLWTETPAERQQRIADEVAGKKRRAANAEEDPVVVADERKKRKHDTEVRQAVEAHNKSSRGQSLIGMHSSKAKSEKKDKDEEPPAIWDHSRDMGLGGRLMDEKQRSKIIADARSLGDRFGSGKGGGYL